MPSVSLAPQARFALSHVSSSVQAGSSFKSRVAEAALSPPLP
jgi:hypothetical protein